MSNPETTPKPAEAKPKADAKASPKASTPKRVKLNSGNILVNR